MVTKLIMHLRLRIQLFFLVISSTMYFSCQNNYGSFSKLEEQYSIESLRYFSEVGFYQNKVLRKWDKNCKVSISGNYTEKDVESLNEFIVIFNRLVATTQMEFTNTEDSNIKISIVNNNSDLKGCKGITWKESPFYSYMIISAKIKIRPIENLEERKRIIHHELLHAIGLSHTKMLFERQNLMGICSYKSIDDYEARTKDGYSLPELDQIAIRILYEKNIPIGLKKEKFQTTIKFNDKYKIVK